MISNDVKAQLDAIEQDAIIDLYELDISQINELGGSNYFYFCNELKEDDSENAFETWAEIPATDNDFDGRV